MPRYTALIYSNTDNTPEELQAVMGEYIAFGDKSTAAGVNVGGEALQPAQTATTVTVAGGKGGDITTTDGPFAETKEVLTGFYLLECANLDEAIGWAAQIPGAWNGKVEVRPIIDFSAMG
jgi:hypothetical protein